MRMGMAVLLATVVALLRNSRRVGAVLIAIGWLWARQQPPPGPPPGPAGPGIANRLSDLRKKLASAKPVNLTAQRAVQYGREYLTKAEAAQRGGRSFAADRLAEAADSLCHIAEHQQHLREGGGGPKGPPPAADIQDHLQRVYFRTQQADYFLRQSHDARAASFPKWARDFYQLARRAYDRGDMLAADENAKSADEVVKALENLAQAATPANIPPPPPARPPVP